LEVIYRGETVISSDVKKDDVLIEKGGTLEMILSKDSGGSLTMPDLRCMGYDEATFLSQTLNLIVQEHVDDGKTTDETFVWKQDPAANSRVYTGDTIQVYLSQQRPNDCDE
jgi:D-alanine-D-alanine ligase